jgi:hypothetical protein
LPGDILSPPAFSPPKVLSRRTDCVEATIEISPKGSLFWVMSQHFLLSFTAITKITVQIFIIQQQTFLVF